MDDHPVFRNGLARVIDATPGLRVVGEAGDAPSALAALREVKVQVVVVDLTLRRGSGMELIGAILAEHPNANVFVLSALEEDLYALRALSAGALGYLCKDAAPKQICEAIRMVAAGQPYFSPRIQQSVMMRAARGRAAPLGALDALTDRELEVFRCIGRGMGTREIGRHLHVSEKTIETHRGNIKRKLGLRSSGQLVRAAVTAFLPTATGTFEPDARETDPAESP